MKGLIFVLIILLALSIANNYILYKKKTNEKQNFNYVDTNILPDNIGFINYTFFYNKDLKFNKCHKNDLKNKDNSAKKPYMKIILDDHIANLKKKFLNKCVILSNNNNSELNIEDHQILILNSLSKKKIIN